MAIARMTGEVLVDFAEQTIAKQSTNRDAYAEALRKYWAVPFYVRWLTNRPRSFDFGYKPYSYSLASDIFTTIDSCGPQVEFFLDEYDRECLGVTQ